MTIENPADVLERALRKVREENEQLKKQLDYLRSGKYLNQVKWERDFNERMVEDLQQRMDKVTDYIKGNEFYNLNKTGACIKGVIPLLEILKGEPNNE